jgi:hypothetical protein
LVLSTVRLFVEMSGCGNGIAGTFPTNPTVTDPPGPPQFSPRGECTMPNIAMPTSDAWSRSEKDTGFLKLSFGWYEAAEAISAQEALDSTIIEHALNVQSAFS